MAFSSDITKETILCAHPSVNEITRNLTLSNSRISRIIPPSMHLLIVSPFPPTITGIGQYGYHVTRGIADTGAFSRITVLAGARAYAAGSLNHLGNTEIDYCWQPGQLKARQAILSGIKREKPDLVWFNLGASIFGSSPLANLSGMFTPMQARRIGYPTVVTLHELAAFADLRALNVPGGVLAPLGARLLTEIATQADVV